MNGTGAWLATVGVVLAGWTAQPGAAPAGGGAVAAPPAPTPWSSSSSSPSSSAAGLAARQARLDPARPMDYFELAEDYADLAEAGVPDAATQARRLYVLALELDRASASANGLGASAALGLAALARSEGERRWLRAVAARLTSEPDSIVPPPPRRASEPVVPDRLAFDVAVALGSVRSGEGRRASRLLAQPGADGLLTRFAGILADQPGVDPIARLRRQIDQWPTCPQCRNKRTVTGTPRAGQTEGLVRLCPTCGGTPGPRLSVGELTGHLKLESLLLSGIQRRWSASVLADGGEPLRDPEPGQVAPRLAVDPAATLFRDGRWVAPESPRPRPPAAPAASPAERTPERSGAK